MRINVYNEELTGETEVVETTPETGRTFYGCRVFLASADELHHAADDDDRSAITFWTGDKATADALALALAKVVRTKVTALPRASLSLDPDIERGARALILGHSTPAIVGQHRHHERRHG